MIVPARPPEVAAPGSAVKTGTTGIFIPGACGSVCAEIQGPFHQSVAGEIAKKKKKKGGSIGRVN